MSAMDLLGVFVWSFLAATVLPLGSEPALAAIVNRRDAIAPAGGRRDAR